MTTTSLDPRLAAWADVRAKAVRLRNSGALHLDTHNDMLTTATVQGDNGVYQVELWRTDPDSHKIVTWSCSCPWGYWAFRRIYKYVGRTCSHTLAVFYEARSQDYKEIVQTDVFDESPTQLRMDLSGPNLQNPGTHRY